MRTAILTLPVTATGCSVTVYRDSMHGGVNYSLMLNTGPNEEDCTNVVYSASGVYHCLAESSIYLFYKGEHVMFRHCRPLQDIANALDAVWND